MLKKMNQNRGGMILGLVVLAVIAASAGCTVQDREANAQGLENRQIETFTIADNTFRMTTSGTQPTVQLFDVATRYAINANTTLTFTQSGGGDVTLQLEINDIVIERPGSGVITIIRDF